MKTDLINIIKSQQLSPRGYHWTDDDIIPTLIRRSRVVISSTAMDNQTPKVISIKTATNKPKALKVCQGIPIDIKANNGRLGAALSL